MPSAKELTSPPSTTQIISIKRKALKESKINETSIELGAPVPGGYELCLMSELPEDNPEKAEEYKLYLSDKGDYIVRGQDGSVKKGSLSTEGIDLINLPNRLQEQALKKAILAVTSKRGQTLPGSDASSGESEEFDRADSIAKRAQIAIDSANRENQKSPEVPNNPTETNDNAKEIAQINSDNTTVDNTLKKLIENILDFRPDNSNVKPDRYWNQNARNEGSKELVGYIAAALNSNDYCLRKVSEYTTEEKQGWFVYYTSKRLSWNVTSEYDISTSRIRNFLTPFSKHYFYTPMLRESVKNSAETKAKANYNETESTDYKNAIKTNIHNQLVQEALKPAIKDTNSKFNIK